MESLKTIAVPAHLKEKLDELKLSRTQAYYEVIEALVNYFEKNSKNKIELWVQGDDGKK